MDPVEPRIVRVFNCLIITSTGGILTREKGLGRLNFFVDP
jgi:hypothetical protein